MINIDNDNPLLTQGAWAEFEGSKFLVTHMSNLAFQRAWLRKQQPHRKKIEAGTLDPAIVRDLMTQAMAEAMILDWQKVVDGEGKEVPFSKEACVKALANNPELRDFVSEFSMQLDNFRQEEKKALGKA